MTRLLLGILATLCLTDAASLLPSHRLVDLVSKRLVWATSHLAETCDAYEVEIRYSCQEHPEATFQSLEEFDLFCDDYLPRGLKKHMERSITMNDGKTYQLRVSPRRIRTVAAEEEDEEEHGEASMMVTLAWSCGRSNNWLYRTMVAYVCGGDDPDYFMEMIAHEFGHAIVPASGGAQGGFWASLTHKGTSTPWQTHLPDSVQDCDLPELDVMHYFHSERDNCREKPAPPVLLSEEDAAGLVEGAEAGRRPAACGGAGRGDGRCGALCLGSAWCSGRCLRCRCFTCVE